MLNFNNKKINQLIANFITYMTDPKHDNGKQKINVDQDLQIHHIDSLASKSNLNIVISSYILTPVQQEQAKKIIKQYHEANESFTWCTITEDNQQLDRDFYQQQGLEHFETAQVMLLDLNNFNMTNDLAENITFQTINSPEDVKKVKNVIHNAFDLALIDLAKYQSLFEINQDEKISYFTILTQDNQPATTGNLYLESELAIVDDIATHQNFQKQGFAKAMLIHLLNYAKTKGYQTVGLIATPDGFPLYKKLGFVEQEVYINVYTMNY
ncbi:GNAT family N-acetyltransferase [Spiroplasma chrysopicola]|uniref:N-acetyltransferase domain-containing protein n=1 Tax=Spiroplasma chrysopicola DF-1 TaxID=1276227 RepID=R4UFP1_9MOLU|nr:GNAT family N-acetyltransferase [Spiroplasma chrysopicola]AGM24980.1 hypothetical protein SCHRY_v1c03980 [Spiroplasma chrysopicola DF-1]